MSMLWGWSEKALQMRPLVFDLRPTALAIERRLQRVTSI